MNGEAREIIEMHLEKQKEHACKQRVTEIFLSMKKSIESIKLERLNRLQLSPSRLLELTKDNNKDDRP